MTDMRNLHNLVEFWIMSYDTWDIFNNAIALNRPFIHALSRSIIGNLLLRLQKTANSEVVQEMTADEEVYQRTERTIAEIFENVHCINGHD